MTPAEYDKANFQAFPSTEIDSLIRARIPFSLNYQGRRPFYGDLPFNLIVPKGTLAQIRQQIEDREKGA